MTIPVFVPGMHIADDGTLVIHADEAAEAGVKSIELIEGTPEARIAELEARAEAARNAQRTVEREHLAVCAELDEAMADVRRLRAALMVYAHQNFWVRYKRDGEYTYSLFIGNKDGLEDGVLHDGWLVARRALLPPVEQKERHEREKI